MLINTRYSIVTRALGLVAARARKGILNTRVGRDYVILLTDDTGCLARGGHSRPSNIAVIKGAES